MGKLFKSPFGIKRARLFLYYPAWSVVYKVYPEFSEQSQRTATNDFCYPGTTAARSSDGDTGTVGTAPFFLTHTCVYI